MMQDVLAMRKSLDEETAPLNDDLGKIYGAKKVRFEIESRCRRVLTP